MVFSVIMKLGGDEGHDGTKQNFVEKQLFVPGTIQLFPDAFLVGKFIVGIGGALVIQRVFLMNLLFLIARSN